MSRGLIYAAVGLGAAIGVYVVTKIARNAIQIAGYAQNAGFSGTDLVTAVAVALAESGGNPNAYNPETAASGGTPVNEGSYGLWQIYLKDHPEFAGQNLFDPQTNANAAYSVWQRAGGWSPWSTFKSGAYSQYISQAQGQISATAPSSFTAGVEDTSAELTDDSTDEEV